MSPSVNLPVTLMANTPENVADLNANLNAIVAALNGGLDEVNVPNLAAAFTAYKGMPAQARARVSSAAAAGTYLLSLGGTGLNLSVTNQPALEDVLMILDPARFNANTRTTRLNLRLQVVANAVAPAITFTAGLYPLTAASGASGVQPLPSAIGAVVAGSTAAVATPAALSLTATASSGDFNYPAAGPYVIGVATSGTPAAGSVCSLIATLDVRQV